MAELLELRPTEQEQVERNGTWPNFPGIWGARLRGSWWKGAPGWRRRKGDGRQRRGATEPAKRKKATRSAEDSLCLAATPRCWGAQLPRPPQRQPEEMRKGAAESGASPAGSTTHSPLFAVSDLYRPLAGGCRKWIHQCSCKDFNIGFISYTTNCH
jgi:hypothetical protein